MSERVDAVQALSRLAAWGLPGHHTAPILVGSLDQLRLIGERERVLPQLYHAVNDGAIADVPDSWLAELRDRSMAAAETTISAHAAARTLAGEFAEIGLDDAVVLKGCATAHLDYERAADRFSSDIDVLVRSTAVEDVIEAFGQLPQLATRSETWNRRYGHATTLKGLNGVDIDVHVRLAQAYVGLSIPPDELREHTVRFEIGGVAMQALDGPNRLIHAAVHARSMNTRMHSKRDVPQLVLVSEVDWEEAIRRAERWQIDHFFALGVVTAWSAFGIPSHPLVHWAERYDRPAGRRQRIAARLGGSRLRGNVIAAPLALPVRHWPGYIGPMLFPSKAYVDENDKGWRTRLRIFTDEVRNR